MHTLCLNCPEPAGWPVLTKAWQPLVTKTSLWSGVRGRACPSGSVYKLGWAVGGAPSHFGLNQAYCICHIFHPIEALEAPRESLDSPRMEPEERSMRVESIQARESQAACSTNPNAKSTLTEASAPTSPHLCRDHLLAAFPSLGEALQPGPGSERPRGWFSNGRGVYVGP